MKASNFLLDNTKFNAFNLQGGLLNRMSMKPSNFDLSNVKFSGVTASPALSNISIDGSMKNENE